MTREYWSIGKPGKVWALVDYAEENKELIDNLLRTYPCTSQYINGKKLVAITVELPIEDLDSSFKKID